MVKTQVFQSIKTREDWRLSQAYRRYTIGGPSARLLMSLGILTHGFMGDKHYTAYQLPLNTCHLCVIKFATVI